MSSPLETQSQLLASAPLHSPPADEAHASTPAADPLHPADASSPDSGDTLGSVPDANLHRAIEAAGDAIAPLWPLRNFVAVNPYLGFAGLPFQRGIEEVEAVFHARATMPLEYYASCFAQERIGEEDLRSAIAAAPELLGRPELADLDRNAMIRLLEEPPRSPEGTRVPTYADAADAIEGSRWERVIVEEISRWCAARFDAGQAGWQQPWPDLAIYPAWIESAKLDRNPEVRGIARFREYVEALPRQPDQAIASVLCQLGVPAAENQRFLARQLASISGWAGHLRFRIREAGMRGQPASESLTDLLAIRLAFDGALHAQLGNRPSLDSWPNARNAANPLRAPAKSSDEGPRTSQPQLSNPEARHLWQVAFESAYRRRLLTKIHSPVSPITESGDSPLLQAVFCIDVRSEVLRRKLESCSDRIRTTGFAGFFGVAIEFLHPGDRRGESRCPVLLSPAHRIQERGRHHWASVEQVARKEQHHDLFKSIRLSTVSAFPFVETVGYFFGLRLATDSLGWTRPGDDSRLFAGRKASDFQPEINPSSDATGSFGLNLEARVSLAENMLRGMGMLDSFAQVVLLCGHGSRTTNNPYGSALDCGACGGYPGDANANVAARVLNDPAVRSALVLRGIVIPESTRFVSGLHETTTDRIELLEAADVDPETLDTIRGWLDQACRETARERAARLGLDPKKENSRRLRRRSRDWSEVRPEWGLAGNAALIAAPRSRTRGLDLEGRTFLHDYQAEKDPDGKVLELILTAPMIVASWINLQYYASTVSNDVFGSGSKVLHNVVGRHGVMLGNVSDLRSGLPWQSVHDGERFVHEPLRLHAVVEAPLDKIEGVLMAHDSVRELIENRWIHLIAVEPGSSRFHQWHAGGFREISDGGS
jgi:uncharacterized protein YbcC (UPF0753/DUF2309 family)